MKYLVANIPVEEVSAYGRKLSADIAETFSITDPHDRIPPHFTLWPPFSADKTEIEEVKKLIRSVTSAHQPAPMDMFGFGHFGDGVVYLAAAASGEVWSTADDLRDKLADLSFIPKPKFSDLTFHLTLARPESKKQREEIMSYLRKNHSPHFTVGFKNITLLKKPDGADEWKIEKTYRIV